MPIDAWAMDAVAGAPSYSGLDMRMGTILPFLAGAGASLGVRSGVRPSGSGTDLLVQAQASPNMSVKINPGVIVVQGAISATQGPYTWTNDTTLTRTIAAAHATLTRTDLVVVRIRDGNVDTSGARDGDVVVITGTAGAGVPSLPTDATYIEIGRVAVGANVSTIVAGNVTDRRPKTVAVGGILPVNATTEPSASLLPPGTVLYREDLDSYKRVTSAGAYAPFGPYRDVKTVASTVPSVTFSGIPTTLRKIIVSGTARANNAAVNCDVFAQVNGVTTVSYRVSRHGHQNGTPFAVSDLNQSGAQIGTVAGNSAAAGVFGEFEAVISGWNSPHAGYLTIGGRGGFVDLGGAVVVNCTSAASITGPYTSITVLPTSPAQWLAGSEFVLLGWE